MARDVWRVDDYGWDGWVLSGPYTEAEARRRFGTSVLVRIIHNAPPPFYMYDDEPTEE